MKLYANLHTHSTHSDGGFTPKQLARAAKKEGYSALALTDHDTVTGYTELREECEKLGLETIFGAEFSSPSKMLEKNKDKYKTIYLDYSYSNSSYQTKDKTSPAEEVLIVNY